MAGFESSAGFGSPEPVITSMAGFAGGGVPTSRRTQHDPCRPQVIARRLATHPRRLLYPTKGPTKTPQRYDLFPLLSAQDIAHANRG